MNVIYLSGRGGGGGIRFNKPNLGADHLTFEGGVWVISEKIIVQISRAKTSCEEIPSLKLNGIKLHNKRSPYNQRSLL